MTDNTPITPFRFRDLPGEIRKKIYCLILCEFRRPEEKSDNSLDLLNCMETNTLVEHEVETTILLTSKEIYREAYDVMVKTNRFVKITSVRSIPLPVALSGHQAPLVSAKERVVNNFKGYVLDIHLNYKREGQSVRDDRELPGRQAMTCMVLHRDLVKVCSAFNDLDAHLKGLVAMLKMSITIAPNLECMRSDPISPSFDDFFTKKTQQALLKPLTDNLYGYQGVQIKGHVDSALAAAARQDLAQDRYSNPTAVLAEFAKEKEEGSRLFREKNSEAAILRWLDAALEVDKLLQSTSWPKLIRRGGEEFVSQLATIYFLMQLNIAHVQVGSMPGFAPELLAENALNMAVRSIAKNYWMKDYKYVPAPTHMAKLRYRFAMFYRLQANPENANRALVYINGALNVQPGDAAIMREKENIVAWKQAV
ncbi:hypothetical protein HRS9122_05325 [Pyrenophora teres f. teres]|nr:hypothetical protein HRS9122_05325 [Pyrenophora teres f. teres]